MSLAAAVPDHGRFGGPQHAQLEAHYEVLAAFRSVPLKKDKLVKAVMIDRPAAEADDKKANPLLKEWDAMNEEALEAIQISVKPLHLSTVTSVVTAKEA